MAHTRATRPPPARRTAWWAAAAVAALLSPGAAGADGADDAQTRVMRVRFAEGRALQAAGRWADALGRFEEVDRARPTASVRFHVALCLDRLGRLRQAEQAYRVAIAAALGQSPDVVTEARARLADLDARAPRVVVALTGVVDGVTVALDGETIAEGATVRVDPGPHVAVARRDGIQVAAAAFSTIERRTRIVELRIYPPPGAPDPSPTAAQATAPR